MIESPNSGIYAIWVWDEWLYHKKSRCFGDTVQSNMAVVVLPKRLYNTKTKQGFDFYDCLFRTKTLLHSQHSPITYIYIERYIGWPLHPHKLFNKVQ